MDNSVLGVRYGEVISIDDPAGAGRIAVRVTAYDNNQLVERGYLDVDAFPLMPKMFHVMPKVGEGVFVIYSELENEGSIKYYIGPVISQLHRMYREEFASGGRAYQPGGKNDFDQNPNHGDAIGAFPDETDVAILGRKNCDIQIKDDDIRIRAGVKLAKDDSNYDFKFNGSNPAFIKLKYHEIPLLSKTQSTATILADKILLSGRRNPGIKDTLNKEELITDDDIIDFIKNGYRLPYGEKLVKLLQEMIRVFKEHTHDFMAKTPNNKFVTEIDSLDKMFLSKADDGVPPLLSDTVRIK
jgi:hypothetical protein